MSYWKNRLANAQSAITEKNLKQIKKQLAKYYAFSMKRIIAEFESTETESKPVILDMSGRRIMNPVKGGVYIVNGKKVVFM